MDGARNYKSFANTLAGSTVTFVGTNGGAGGDCAVRGWLRLATIA